MKNVYVNSHVYININKMISLDNTYYTLKYGEVFDESCNTNNSDSKIPALVG